VNVDFAGRRVLYVVAHPDDEDAATVTWLAKHAGADVTLFSLTRGEMGDNAVGTEIAESLGALRMDEMRCAADVYGVRNVWFGSCFDYGYSKRLEEAWERWGEGRVVRDVVRAIRASKAEVLISRFRGEESDGHAHHRAVGMAVRRAVEASPDRDAFPELMGAGLLAHEVSLLLLHASSAESVDVTIHAEAALADAARGYVLHRSQVTERLLMPGDTGIRFYSAVGHGRPSPRGEGTSDYAPLPSTTGNTRIAPLRRTSPEAAFYESSLGAEALLARPDTTNGADAARAVPGTIPQGVRVPSPGEVAFIEGTGDCFAHALGVLGLRVTKVAPDSLDTASLEGFTRVCVGVRAFARASDADALASALRSAAHRGAQVVVFAQTPEFVPERHAPHRGTLPPSPPEVADEGAPVELLDPTHPFLSSPNVITGADFDGWVEQRGSKFWTEWDRAYEPLVAAADPGDATQHGIWLTTKVGAGTWTYCALALHRQLPFGVIGAWRILANLFEAQAPATSRP
jgi:LmbE family N-acetylglucosaminyl deacetylase